MQESRRRVFRFRRSAAESRGTSETEPSGAAPGISRIPTHRCHFLIDGERLWHLIPAKRGSRLYHRARRLRGAHAKPLTQPLARGRRCTLYPASLPRSRGAQDTSRVRAGTDLSPCENVETVG